MADYAKGKWGLFCPVVFTQCVFVQQNCWANTTKRGKFGVHIFVNKQDFRGLGRFFLSLGKQLHWANTGQTHWANKKIGKERSGLYDGRELGVC